ncbi:MAG: PTS transporter subunit EIIC, partial [Peptostreptococcaceae bacterium]
MENKRSFNDKIQAFAGKFSTQRHLIALRDAMAGVMPLIIIGSVFMLIAQFPYEPFTNFLNDIGLQAILNKASDSTFGILGFAVTFTTAYNLAMHYKLNAVPAGLLSIASFILLTPLVTGDAGTGFPTKYLGSSGLFVGILVAMVSTEIFRWFVVRDIMIKMPESVPPNVSKAFSAIIPGFAVVVFWLVILVVLKAFGIDNIHSLIADTVGALLGV